MSLESDATLGPYRIIERIGRGGMATVYRAYHTALERYVAIKVLPAFFAEDEEFRHRFKQEALAVAQLHHPNILVVFDFGEADDALYLVSEYIEGGTLAEHLSTPLEPADAVRFLAPIAAALDYAHEQGVLHRDVKPANILLRSNGDPVLSDFGLAKILYSSSRFTRTNIAMGTPEYMAPEQGTSESAIPSADNYALAVVAYELLTGHLPFSRETPLAVLLAHMHEPPPQPRLSNPAIPLGVEHVVLKGLAKARQDRYPTATAFVTALSQAASEPMSYAASDYKAATTPLEIPPAQEQADSQISDLAVADTDATTMDVPSTLVSPAVDAQTIGVPDHPIARRGRPRLVGILVVAIALVALAVGLRSRGFGTQQAAAPLPTALHTMVRTVVTPHEVSLRSSTVTAQPSAPTPTERLATATFPPTQTVPNPTSTTLPTGTAASALLPTLGVTPAQRSATATHLPTIARPTVAVPKKKGTRIAEANALPRPVATTHRAQASPTRERTPTSVVQLATHTPALTASPSSTSTPLPNTPTRTPIATATARPSPTAHPTRALASPTKSVPHSHKPLASPVRLRPTATPKPRYHPKATVTPTATPRVVLHPATATPHVVLHPATATHPPNAPKHSATATPHPHSPSVRRVALPTPHPGSANTLPPPPKASATPRPRATIHVSHKPTATPHPVITPAHPTALRGTPTPVRSSTPTPEPTATLPLPTLTPTPTLILEMSPTVTPTAAVFPSPAQPLPSDTPVPPPPPATVPPIATLDLTPPAEIPAPTSSPLSSANAALPTGTRAP